MSVFIVKFDDSLWQAIMDEAIQVYGSAKVTKPTRLSENSKLLKARLRDFNDSHVTFVMEVPALIAKKSEHNPTLTEIANPPFLLPREKASASPATVPSIHQALLEAQCSVHSAYQLNRKQAVEVLVWLLSDVNRMWQPEIPHSVPIAYGLKGYSLPSDIMRGICDDILQACHEKGLHIACTCFDGQWLPLANRSSSGKALTLLQLQRNVWSEVKALQKQDLASMVQNTLITDTIVAKSVNSSALNASSKTMLRFQSFLRVGSRQLETDLQDDAIDGVSYLSSDAIEAFHMFADDARSSDTAERVNSTNQMQTATRRGLETTELLVIVHKLQNHLNDGTSRKWSEMSVDGATYYLRNILSSAEHLQNLLTRELDVIIETTKDLQKSYGLDVKKSWNKTDKVNGLCLILQNGTQLDTKENTIRPPPPSLAQFCVNSICSPKSKLSVHKMPSKDVLNVVAAMVLYPSRRDEWEQSAPFDIGLKIEGLDDPKFWFAYPEFNERRGQLEPKCLDSHHLLVNCRAKVCKDGFPGYGIKPEAWVKVAESDSSIISKALVVDLLDKQNNGFARRTFSEKVEEKMITLGYSNEAAFCRLMRCWYLAEDTKGVNAMTRTQYRLDLRKFLLDPIDLAQFPPYGSHVFGMPRPMLEGFLQCIDTKIQLYGIVKGKAMNARAIGSLQNETFFGEMTDMEQTKLGCPKAVSIPRIMSTVTELMHYRNNPNNR